MSSNTTAIIPVYNGKCYLREAIESILAQTVRPDRLILVDDGSTDGSILSLEGLDIPIPLTVLTQENAGQAAARSRAIALAETDFIALLDQDDAWYPRHLEVLLEALRDSPAMGWAYSDCDLVGAEGAMVTPRLLETSGGTHPKRDLRTCLSEDMLILPGASLIRRQALDDIGGFDPRFVGYEDDDLFLRLFLAGWDNAYIPEPHSFWRLHHQNTMNTQEMRESRRAYAQKLMDAFPNQPEAGTFLTRDCIAPRFVALNMHQYQHALIRNDLDCCRAALEDIDELVPLCRRSRRRSLMLRAMRYPRVLLLPLHVRHLARTMTNRLPGAAPAGDA